MQCNALYKEISKDVEIKISKAKNFVWVLKYQNINLSPCLHFFVSEKNRIFNLNQLFSANFEMRLIKVFEIFKNKFS
jgi:hypothetical protein